MAIPHTLVSCRAGSSLKGYAGPLWPLKQDMKGLLSSVSGIVFYLQVPFLESSSSNIATQRDSRPMLDL